MKKLLLLTILFSAGAFAADYPRDIVYCWNLPTQYVDGSDILPGDLTDIRIVTVRQSGETIIDSLIPVGANLPGDRQCHTFTAAVPQPGTYTAVAYALTADDVSDASGESVKRFTGKPLPPNSVSN